MVKARLMLGGIVALVVAVLVVGVGVMWWVSSSGSRGAATGSSSTVSGSRVEPSPGAGTQAARPVDSKPPQRDGVDFTDGKAVAEAFAKVWVDPNMPEKEWLSRLSRYASPALVESAKTADRKLAAVHSAEPTSEVSAFWGTTVVSFDPNDGFIVEIVHDVVGSAADGSENYEWRVVGVNYPKIPDGAFAPISFSTRFEYEQLFTDAAKALFGNEANATAKDHEARIREVFSDPVEALKFPRTGAEGESVLVAPIDAVTWSVDDKGRLTASFSVQYGPPNTDPAQRQFGAATLVVERADNGKWRLVDAYQSR